MNKYILSGILVILVFCGLFIFFGLIGACVFTAAIIFISVLVKVHKSLKKIEKTKLLNQEGHALVLGKEKGTALPQNVIAQFAQENYLEKLKEIRAEIISQGEQMSMVPLPPEHITTLFEFLMLMQSLESLADKATTEKNAFGALISKAMLKPMQLGLFQYAYHYHHYGAIDERTITIAKKFAESCENDFIGDFFK